METEAQLGYLRKHHCDVIQGFFFDPALPPDEFMTRLRKGGAYPFPVHESGQAVRTLLIVGNEPHVVRALCRTLADEGYRILVASNAFEALDMLAKEDIQVVMSDQRMPLMTDTEFFTRLEGQHPETVRIILSGYADLETVSRTISDGAIYKILNKPWDNEQLRSYVRESFRRYERGMQSAWSGGDVH